MTDDISKIKLCNRCKKEKSIDEFRIYHTDTFYYEGTLKYHYERYDYCKECEPKKICSKCKEEISLFDFYKTNKYIDGRTAWCKKCIDDYYEENPDEKYKWNKDYHKYYYTKNRERILANNRKYKRKKKQEKLKRIRREAKKNKKKEIAKTN